MINKLALQGDPLLLQLTTRSFTIESYKDIIDYWVLQRNYWLLKLTNKFLTIEAYKYILYYLSFRQEGEEGEGEGEQIWNRIETLFFKTLISDIVVF